jgi:glyceraldehyde-3-phosphate dehydrogenase (NADP+)
MVKEFKFYSAGKWKSSKQKYKVINPFSEKVVAEVFVPSRKDVLDSISAAEKAFRKTRELSSKEKAEILFFVAKQIEKKKNEFARTISLEAGKPLKHSLIEVKRAILTLFFSGEEAKRIKGELLPIDLDAGSKKKLCLIKRFPLGVISGISPFNFPLNLVAHKIGPAIASGNTIVLKPAERTPLSALKLAELFHETELPKGALSVLPVDRNNAQPFVEDDRIKLLSFTGSSTVGWKLKERAGKKKVLLELGGNAATIVDETAEIKKAAEKIAKAAFSFSGQSCISVQRIMVHSKIYSAFKKELIKEIKKLNVGSPFNPRTDLSAVIDSNAAERAMNWIKEAINSGAKVLIGNKRKGNVVYPTLLENVPFTAKCYSEETFAPIKTIEKFASLNEALSKVNNSRYGLQAGIFTQHLGNAFKAFNSLDVGGLMVNEVSAFRQDNYPYGGVKDSGFGREGVKYAIQEMTELKVMVIDLSE